MRTPKRHRQSSVIDRLLDAPWRFDLVQALRLIDAWLRRNGLTHDDDMLRHVRFKNSLSMNFPASQVEALTVEGAVPITSGSALQLAFDSGDLKTITFTPAFLGFFGVNGAMPNFYTDDIADQIHTTRFEGTRAFFDIFTNRTMALYFQAACKHRVQHRFDEHGAAAILPMQLALAGQRPTPDRVGICHDAVRAHYAALLRHRPVSGDMIEAMLVEYFALPIRLEPFVAGHDRLRQHELCLLGVQCATLSEGAVLGERVHEVDTRACLHIGPLALADFNNFLPGAAGAVELTQLLALFATPTVRFQLHLILRAADVKPVSFSWFDGNRLGYDSSLIGSPALADCGEFICNLDL
ncbi:MAG: type VI secretion system baseplate subunit TssG [Pseudomonadota bacterium]|nr:type VI secretion system baseplate subunit TssG [Pseudomonadota bacterium]